MSELIPVKERAVAIQKLLLSREDTFKTLLPAGMDPKRFITIGLLNINRNPQLAQCDPNSFYLSMLNAAHLGLDPDGVKGLGYLVPLREKGTLKCNFWIGYRGIMQLSYEGGAVASWEARPVMAGDDFGIEFGLTPRLQHTPKDEVTPGGLVGAYAIARLSNGGVVWDYMTRKAIDNVMARSRARDNGPWVTDYVAMALKTAVKKTAKMVPMVSPKFAEAVGLADREEAGLPQVDLTGLGLDPEKEVGVEEGADEGAR